MRLREQSFHPIYPLHLHQHLKAGAFEFLRIRLEIPNAVLQRCLPQLSINGEIKGLAPQPGHVNVEGRELDLGETGFTL